MKKSNLLQSNWVGICTDCAPSMVGLIKGFTALEKKENEKIIFTHCFLLCDHLVAKSIGNELKDVINQAVQMSITLNVGFCNHDYL